MSDQQRTETGSGGGAQARKTARAGRGHASAAHGGRGHDGTARAPRPVAPAADLPDDRVDAPGPRHRDRPRLPRARHGRSTRTRWCTCRRATAGRIVLSRDPDGAERCVACYLCAAACPVDCIALQATQDETGRRYPEWFRINFSRCIFCGFCEDACPTYAIQLTPDVEMCEYERPSMVYEKEDLLIAGTGKYRDYDFYRVAGLAVGGKDKGEAENEAPPVDLHDLLP